jgi:hypothetical protein
VMVLSWSRQILLRFFPDARMASFLRGHAAAFHAWGGSPRVLLPDYVPRHIIVLLCPSPLCGVAPVNPCDSSCLARSDAT